MSWRPVFVRETACDRPTRELALKRGELRHKNVTNPLNFVLSVAERRTKEFMDIDAPLPDELIRKIVPNNLTADLHIYIDTQPRHIPITVSFRLKRWTYQGTKINDEYDYRWLKIDESMRSAIFDAFEAGHAKIKADDKVLHRRSPPHFRNFNEFRGSSEFECKQHVTLDQAKALAMAFLNGMSDVQTCHFTYAYKKHLVLPIRDGVVTYNETKDFTDTPMDGELELPLSVMFELMQATTPYISLLRKLMQSWEPFHSTNADDKKYQHNEHHQTHQQAPKSTDLVSHANHGSLAAVLTAGLHHLEAGVDTSVRDDAPTIDTFADEGLYDDVLNIIADNTITTHSIPATCWFGPRHVKLHIDYGKAFHEQTITGFKESEYPLPKLSNLPIDEHWEWEIPHSTKKSQHEKVERLLHATSEAFETAVKQNLQRYLGQVSEAWRNLADNYFIVCASFSRPDTPDSEPWVVSMDDRLELKVECKPMADNWLSRHTVKSLQHCLFQVALKPFHPSFKTEKFTEDTIKPECLSEEKYNGNYANLYDTKLEYRFQATTGLHERDRVIELLKRIPSSS